MEFLGIGPLELLIILMIALLLLGPRDMAKAGRNLGRFLRKVVTSPQWRTITQTSREIRNIPTRLIREAGLEDLEKDVNLLKKTTGDIQASLREQTILPPDWLTSPTIKPDPKGAVLDKQPEISANPADRRPLSCNEGLTAWTNDTQEEAPVTGNKEGSDNLSAWITPPNHPNDQGNS
jgi:sec-independent protein translocase protein TatB